MGQGRVSRVKGEAGTLFSWKFSISGFFVPSHLNGSGKGHKGQGSSVALFSQKQDHGSEDALVSLARRMFDLFSDEFPVCTNPLLIPHTPKNVCS